HHRVGAGVACRHLHGGGRDVGVQLGGERQVGHDPAQENDDGHHPGEDRPVNEEPCEHGKRLYFLGAGAGGFSTGGGVGGRGPCGGTGMGTSVGLTVAPCRTRWRPLTMTRSPGLRPSVTTWRPSWSEPSFTAWRTTLLFLSTT